MTRHVVVSRRGLLQAGLVGSAAVWGSGLLGCTRRAAQPAGGQQRAALSPSGEEIVRAVIPVVLGPCCRAPARRASRRSRRAWRASTNTTQSRSRCRSDEARDVFATLDLLPVRLLLLGMAALAGCFARCRRAFLRSARQSRVFLLRRIFAFLQSMTVLAWFDQPAAWREIGYPGPPIGPYAPGGTQS
jgi:hypothetical protein